MDLSGQKFGRWTVVRKSVKITKCRDSYWWCVCSCKNLKEVSQRILRSGESQSCGCLRLEKCLAAVTKHGSYKTPEYKAWLAIKARCLNTKDKRFPNYGGRGIKICKMWQTSFKTFIQDVGFRPTHKHSIDRIDNEKNYSCGKCSDCKTHNWSFNTKWSTYIEQLNNTRHCRYITYLGKTKTISQWARHYKLSFSCLKNRINSGWPVAKALTTPVRLKQSLLQIEAVNDTI